MTDRATTHGILGGLLLALGACGGDDANRALPADAGSDAGLGGRGSNGADSGTAPDGSVPANALVVHLSGAFGSDSEILLGDGSVHRKAVDSSFAAHFDGVVLPV